MSLEGAKHIYYRAVDQQGNVIGTAQIVHEDMGDAPPLEKYHFYGTTGEEVYGDEQALKSAREVELESIDLHLFAELRDHFAKITNAMRRERQEEQASGNASGAIRAVQNTTAGDSA